jgi:HD superfamily phosphodiesterase
MLSMTTTRSNVIASVGATIYESPDGGKTIYARERGSSNRVLVRTDDTVEETKKLLARRDRLTKICELAKTVPALNDQLEKLETIYLLVKNEND